MLLTFTHQQMNLKSILCAPQKVLESQTMPSGPTSHFPASLSLVFHVYCLA